MAKGKMARNFKHRKPREHCWGGQPFTRDGNPAGEWNNKADDLAGISLLKKEQITEDWDQLLEWLHVKRQQRGAKDLYKEALAQDWPVTRERRKTCVSSCEQSQTGDWRNIL